jgi:hypothetical protein
MKRERIPMNDNDAYLTELTTAQDGSTVEDNAPNTNNPAKFNLVVTAVAGHAVGGSGAPYKLTITAMDLTAVGPATTLNPTIPAQTFDGPPGAATIWKQNGTDFVSSQTFSINVPAATFAGHTLQYTASLVSNNSQIVSILQSDPFVLV